MNDARRSRIARQPPHCHDPPRPGPAAAFLVSSASTYLQRTAGSIEEAADGTNDGVDLRVAMGGIERQAQGFLGQPLGNGESARGKAALAISRLKVDRRRVMDVAADS